VLEAESIAAWLKDVAPAGRLKKTRKRNGDSRESLLSPFPILGRGTQASRSPPREQNVKENFRPNHFNPTQEARARIEGGKKKRGRRKKNFEGEKEVKNLGYYRGEKNLRSRPDEKISYSHFKRYLPAGYRYKRGKPEGTKKMQEGPEGEKGEKKERFTKNARSRHEAEELGEETRHMKDPRFANQKKIRDLKK